MRLAIIEVEFDYNSGDIDRDTADAAEHAWRIARDLTDNEPRVMAANVTEVH